MSDSSDPEESIARRLRGLGVATSPDEIAELRSAYDALLAWLRIASELGGDEKALDAPAAST